MASTQGWGFHADLVVEDYLKLPLLTQLKALVFIRERKSFGSATTDGRQPCSTTTIAAHWQPCSLSTQAPAFSLAMQAFLLDQMMLCSRMPSEWSRSESWHLNALPLLPCTHGGLHWPLIQ